MTKNYEKIKRACQIANPKLMQVGLGTKFLYRHQGAVGLEEHLIVADRGGHWVTDDGRHWDKEQFHLILGLEILGHEPQLSDVLLAINSNRGLNAEFLVHDTGWFYVSGMMSKERTNIFYDLTKPLKDQSEEVLQFIADLL